jgi:hypothetical protein
VGYSVPALPAASHWGQHFALMEAVAKRLWLFRLGSALV